MGILHRYRTKQGIPRSPCKSPPHKQQLKKKLAAALLSFLCCFFACSHVTYAATSKTGVDIATSNGVYTVVAIDEAGNKTFRNITITNIVPKPAVDKDGNIVPDDNIPDKDYTEDIVATLMDDNIINTNGTYTVMVTDQAGNISFQTVTVRNIVQNKNEPGKDDSGNIIPETPLPDDHVEDIVETLKGTQQVTENGQFTAFVRDEAGNLTKRTYTVTNIKEPDSGGTVDPDKPIEIKPNPDTPDTPEDPKEDIVGNLTSNTGVNSNGPYSVSVCDEAGNITMVDIRVTNIKEPDKPVDPSPGPTPTPPPSLPEEIKPDPGVGDTDEDYHEDIQSILTGNQLVTESGIYAAIMHDQSGNLGVAQGTVTIARPEKPDNPTIDPIVPDEPGGEITSPDGNTITDTKIVYENGYYSASGADNVGNIGMETIAVKNIGAPDVKLIDNPASLIRKTAPDGTTYGEATITFTVTVPDGGLLESVRVLNEQKQEMPLTRTNGIYTVTVKTNGIYTIHSKDVAGRTGEYPVNVNYIYELKTPPMIEVMDGATAELDACVTGGIPAKYQWYTCNADGTNAKPIVGANQAVHALKATYLLNNTYYFCVATNGTYEVISKPIKLVVYFAPILQTKGYVVTAEDVDVSMSVGKNNSDTVKILTDGNPSDYTYQWYYAVGSRGQKIPLAGATSPTYTTFAKASMNGYFYFVEISSAKCKTMSEPIYLYVCGKPTAPTVVSTIKGGTVIPSDTWSTSEPLIVTIGNSSAGGTTGTIEYRYSYDQIHWLNYEKPIIFTESTENTTLYVKAINVALTTVDSDIVTHVVKIELEDPSIHVDPDDIVPGVRYNKEVWVNHPTQINVYVNTLSGVSTISVDHKAEGENAYHELVRSDGTAQYIRDDKVADAEHFTATRIEKGLWRITFCAAQNGWYKVSFTDAALRPTESVIGTQPFEVTHIDYGIPTMGTATLDKAGLANDKTISITDAHDAYSASVYGYSELYAYAYTKDNATVPAQDAADWKPLTGLNSSHTVDSNGTRHYAFDIHLAGEKDNGLYRIWVIDLAGNISEVKVVEVTGLKDKMHDVKFDKSTLDLTVPLAGVVKATFVGEPQSVTVTSSNHSVATASYAMTDTGVCTITVKAVDLGTTTVSILLRDFDGTEYPHAVSVTVKNMVPSVKGEPTDLSVNPDAVALFSATFEGTNLRYQWYTSNTMGATGIPITGANPNFTIETFDDSATMHTSKLTIKKSAMTMTNTYYWCEAIATENTAAYKTQTRIAKLTVFGTLTLPTITANSGRVVSGAWTNTELNFVFGGSVIPEGSGTVGFQYRYDDEGPWSNCANSLSYRGDTHSKTLHVRGYNTLNPDIHTAEVDFIIKVDTILPSFIITGNPTSWVSTDQTLTAAVSDKDSGITDDTVKLTIKDENNVVNNSVVAIGGGKYSFIIKVSGTYTVTASDQAGNITTMPLPVTRIDKKNPLVSIVQGPIDSAHLCPVTIYASDDASTPAELLYTFDGGTSWSQTVMSILKEGNTYQIGSKDAAGNITIKSIKITGASGGGGGGGSTEKPALISSSVLDIADFVLGRNFFLDASGAQHPYASYTVDRIPQFAIKLSIKATPGEGGLLSGYAQLSTGPKYPVYWDEAGTTTASESGGTGYIYINPALLASSAKSANITVHMAEYESADLTKKVNADSISAPIMIDVNAPVATISLNRATNEITIEARDVLSGIKTTMYAIKDNTGTTTTWTPYTGTFSMPPETQVVFVQVTDKVGNISTTTSSDLGGGAGGGPGNAMFEHSYYYRTGLFNYYLIGSGKTNLG